MKVLQYKNASIQEVAIYILLLILAWDVNNRDMITSRDQIMNCSLKKQKTINQDNKTLNE